MNIEALFQFFFQCNKLPGQFALVAQERSHSQKRADNKHVDSRPPDRSPGFPNGQCSLSNGVPARCIHLDGTRTVEDIGGHDGAVLGERVRPTTTTSMAETCGANLVLQVLPFTGRDLKNEILGKTCGANRKAAGFFVHEPVLSAG